MGRPDSEPEGSALQPGGKGKFLSYRRARLCFYSHFRPTKGPPAIRPATPYADRSCQELLSLCLKSAGVSFNKPARIIPIYYAIVNCGTFNCRFRPGKFDHLLDYRLMNLPPILQNKHTCGTLEKALYLVSILANSFGRQNACVAFPLKCKRCRHAATEQAQSGRKEAVSSASPILKISFQGWQIDGGGRVRRPKRPVKCRGRVLNKRN